MGFVLFATRFLGFCPMGCLCGCAWEVSRFSYYLFPRRVLICDSGAAARFRQVLRGNREELCVSLVLGVQGCEVIFGPAAHFGILIRCSSMGLFRAYGCCVAQNDVHYSALWVVQISTNDPPVALFSQYCSWIRRGRIFLKRHYTFPDPIRSGPTTQRTPLSASAQSQRTRQRPRPGSRMRACSFQGLECIDQRAMTRSSFITDYNEANDGHTYVHCGNSYLCHNCVWG